MQPEIRLTLLNANYLSVPLFFFAYSKHAEVTVPSLDDWEKQWKKNPQGIVKPAVVQVDFTAAQADAVTADNEILAAEVAGM